MYLSLILIKAAEALASQVTEENFADGLIYLPFTNIRKISANIAASVGAKTYELGLASNQPRPKDLVKTRFFDFVGKTHFYFDGKTWFFGFGGKTRFFSFGRKNRFGGKIGFYGIGGKTPFCGYGGKTRFCGFQSENSILRF
uniref:Uncharacterized protein n=1 Tax=Brassica oleracea var. oleracea TaxID=109376 RepID=A0A0D3AX39_BRAOL